MVSTPHVATGPPHQRWRLIVLGLLVALVAWHAYDLWTPALTDRSGRLKAPDFLQFYTYAALASESRWTSLYDAEAHAAVARERVDPALSLTDFHPNYSPVVAWVLSPLAALPFVAAMALFAAVSLVFYAGAVALLASTTTFGRRDRLLLVLLAAAWPTLIAVLRYGQLSAMTLFIAATAIACVAKGRPAVAGVMLGLLVYKPNLLIVPALVLLATRQWRVLRGMALGAGAELVLGCSLAGVAAMRDYVRVLAEIARRPELVQFFAAESHSVRGFMGLLGLGDPLLGLTTVLAVPGAAWLALRVWQVQQDWRLRWAALTIAMLVASPHLLTYDLLVLAVPVFLILDYLGASGRIGTFDQWRWALALVYFGAWPGTFIARLYHVQVSTIGMVWLLWLLARVPRADRA